MNPRYPRPTLTKRQRDILELLTKLDGGQCLVRHAPYGRGYLAGWRREIGDFNTNRTIYDLGCRQGDERSHLSDFDWPAYVTWKAGNGGTVVRITDAGRKALRIASMTKRERLLPAISFIEISERHIAGEITKDERDALVRQLLAHPPRATLTPDGTGALVRLKVKGRSAETVGRLLRGSAGRMWTIEWPKIPGFENRSDTRGRMAAALLREIGWDAHAGERDIVPNIRGPLPGRCPPDFEPCPGLVKRADGHLAPCTLLIGHTDRPCEHYGDIGISRSTEALTNQRTPT